MSVVQSIIAIIGLIISIKTKNKFSKIGIVFFSLVFLQFVFFVVEMKVFIPHINEMVFNGVIDMEKFGWYVSMAYILGDTLGAAALITIIVGVIKENSIRNQQKEIGE